VDGEPGKLGVYAGHVYDCATDKGEWADIPKHYYASLSMEFIVEFLDGQPALTY
jgi:hypothetical protein